MDNENDFFSEKGKALFPENVNNELKEKIKVYEPIKYFNKSDPPLFL
jgi:hypothetical protein